MVVKGQVRGVVDLPKPNIVMEFGVGRGWDE